MSSNSAKPVPINAAAELGISWQSVAVILLIDHTFLYTVTAVQKLSGCNREQRLNFARSEGNILQKIWFLSEADFYGNVNKQNVFWSTEHMH
jgi:hypothetical protein